METMEIKDAIDYLTQTMREDVEYANVWHIGLSSAIRDAGVDRDLANLAADYFMQTTFGVRTNGHEITRH